jgi:hypothetical protein
MIKFRQKDFSLKEGHYTGPKDMDKVPGAIEVIGKSAIGGALAGSAVGAMLKDSTAWEGFKTGGKAGGIAGIFLKFFINYLHKPMSKVKFQEIDRNIRREFGIYRMAGVTIGDKLDKRADIDEKFGISDRQVSKYKINFAIQDNKITMYTFDLSNEELDKVDKTLDYYCKKYTGMEYNSSVINYKLNSYAVDIVFTNYQVISNFIMELSQVLGCKINLLDNKAIVDSRLREAGEEGGLGEETTKNFSVAALGKFEALKILAKSGLCSIINTKKGPGISFANFICGLLLSAAYKITAEELIKMGHPAPREDFGNTYLEGVLKKNKYIEGFHYTVGSKSDAPVQLSMISGLLIITANKGKESEELDKILKPWLLKMGRKDTGRVIVWTYSIQSRKEAELIIQKVMKAYQGNINLYDK